MLKVRGTQAFLAKLRKDKALLEGRVTKTHQKLVTMMFTDLVKHSPQWSGNLTENWYIEYKGVRGSYRETPSYVDLMKQSGLPVGFEPYKMGDDPAVSNTLNRELAKVSGIRWNTKVTFVNHTPYASDVEEGEGPHGRPIRDENKLASYGGVAMVGYIDMKYRQLRYLKKAIPK